MALLDSALKNIRSIKIESAWSPPLVLQDPFRPGPPSPLMVSLKPKITLSTDLTKDVIMAPYGEPVPNKWPIVKIGAVIGMVVLISSLVYTVANIRRIR